MAGKDVLSQFRKGLDMGGRATKKGKRAQRQVMRAKRKFKKGDVAGGDKMLGKAKKSALGAKRAGRKGAGSGVRVGRTVLKAGRAAAAGDYAGAAGSFVE
tara:strand:- start:3879 stop:4178 length:300 start_codon:yes stop_codon:yes gene_type:complete